MSNIDVFSGHLADHKQDRLRIACGPCGRNGNYRTKTLRTLLGNPPTGEVPRLLAMKAGCALATKYPGHECRAYFVSPLIQLEVKDLMSAYHAGWQVTLKCERSRQGLKSVKPCLSNRSCWTWPAWWRRWATTSRSSNSSAG